MPRTLNVVTLDVAELAVRMIEAALSYERPPGTTAEEAFAALDQEDQERWGRAAVAAMQYMQERFSERQTVQ